VTRIAAVVAAGELVEGDAETIAHASLVVAADGGAHALDGLGVAPQLLVGDLDSVDPELVDRLAATGTDVERHPVDKDCSDTELAVEAARAAGADEVVLVGAIGGARLDHALSNVLLAADPAYGGTVSVARGRSRMHALHAGDTRTLAGQPGDLVSLLAVGGDATGVTTRGLRWPLSDATLAVGRSRGLSNEITARPATVAVAGGTLLVIETPRGGSV
jgi:thiamine pyrophosphokinase